MNNPLVSILMNCFNCQNYLEEAIKSVLNQTYQNWEIIFWDNQSTDRSKKIFKSFKDKRLKYFISKEHTDLGHARSQAFHHLNGDFIAVLDADDLWLPSKFENQIKKFTDPEVGIVISDTYFFNEFDSRLLYNGKYPHTGWVSNELISNYYVSLETILLRKSMIDKLDYAFDSEFSYIADFDLIFRLSEISKLEICDEPLAKWRVHGSSDSWKSNVSFPIEKEKWLKKQKNIDSTFLGKYSMAINKLHSKNNMLISIDFLSKQRRFDALKYIMKTQFKDWRNYVVLSLCFLPFSPSLMRYLQRRRIKNLLT